VRKITKVNKLIKKYRINSDIYLSSTSSFLHEKAFNLQSQNIYEAKLFLENNYAWMYDEALRSYQNKANRIYIIECYYCGIIIFWGSTRRNVITSCEDCEKKHIKETRKLLEEKDGPKVRVAKMD